MWTIFKKILLNFTLHHKKPTFKKAYALYKASRALEAFPVYITVILIQQVLLTALRAIDHDNPNIIVRQSILLTLTVLTAIFKTKLKKCFEPILFIISCAVYINCMLTLSVEFGNFTFRSVYLQSYFLGVFQQLLIILIFPFKLVVLFYLLPIGLQCFVSIQIGFDGSRQLITDLIMPVCMNLMFVFLVFHLENYERKMFDKHYNSNSERNKFENFFVKSMPYGILVVKETLSEILFTNESFKGTFNGDKFAEVTPNILEKFVVNKDQFNGQEKFCSLFTENQIEINLMTFLQKCNAIKCKGLIGENLTIFVSYQRHCQRTKILFAAPIYNTIYEGETAIAIILNDVTLLKTFVSTKAVDASKDRLLATISHELKTPLNGVIGGLNMALNTTKDKETLSLLTMSKRSAKLLIATVNSLLDLHYIRRGNLILRLSTIQLKNFLEEIESLFETQCAQKGLFLNIKITPEVPLIVKTDKERLSQILINLLTNSIKFTSSGEVTISVRLDSKTEGDILFEVIDTGIGIKAEYQHNISTRMYGNDIEEDIVGTHGIGLGLTVSNNLVKLMNKNRQGIKCVSKYQKGSIFSFSITPDVTVSAPRELTEEDVTSFLEEIDDQYIDLRMSRYKERKEGPSRNFEFSKLSLSMTPDLNEHEELGLINNSFTSREFSTLSRTPNSKHHIMLNRHKLGRKSVDVRVMSPCNRDSWRPQVKTENNIIQKYQGSVLLVDDNPFNLMVARRIIEDIGYKVITATDGEDAITKIKNQKQNDQDFFKLIVMDCQMPIMDGYEATREIIKLMQNKEIPFCPIVALTANDTEEDKKRCKEAGMDDVLSKPLLEDDIEKIKVYLRE